MRIITVFISGFGVPLILCLTGCKTTPYEPQHTNFNCEALRDQMRLTEQGLAVLDTTYDPGPFYYDRANNDIGHRQIIREAQTKIDQTRSELNAVYKSLKCN